MKRQDIEASITCFPICDYAFIQIKDIPFKEEVRHICRTECPRYGKSWSCPPAVGTVEECRSRCEAYEGGFLFTTMTEVSDMENMEELLSTRRSFYKAASGASGSVHRVLRPLRRLHLAGCSLPFSPADASLHGGLRHPGHRSCGAVRYYIPERKQSGHLVQPDSLSGGIGRAGNGKIIGIL